MVEVSGSMRNGVHKLSVLKSLRTPHHLLGADTHELCPEELWSAVWMSSSLFAQVLTCDHSGAAVSVRTDGSLGCWTSTCWMNKHAQIRGYCTLPRGIHSSLRAGLTGARAYSWRKADETTAPLYRSWTAYYDILKVSPNATQAQIKSAYYEQSFINHPDRNTSEDAAQLFALVAEAYSVLGSSSLRKRYDRGILSPIDVQSAGRPSSAPKPRRAPDASKRNVCFDFDAFYEAHYGEQLRREQQMKLRREEFRQQQQETAKKWKEEKMISATVLFLVCFGSVIAISLKS